MPKIRRRWLFATAFSVLLWSGSTVFLQPRWLLATFVHLNPGAVFFAQTEQPLVALTIDDGPRPQTTDEILDVLAEYDAKATFFVIGDRISANTATVQRIHREGHELGNHLSHDEASVRLSSAGFEQSLLETEEAIGTALDSSSAPILRWTRPGMGWYSSEMIAIAQEHGYRTALGDTFPYDTHLHSTTFAQHQILSSIRPGSILILHDGSSTRGQRTARTLRRVLPELGRRGYRMVTLSQLFSADMP